MDARDTLAIAPACEEARTFHKGLAPVKICGQWGVIDTSGNVVINPQFDMIGGFADASMDKISQCYV